jgi:N utilization substance protein A
VIDSADKHLEVIVDDSQLSLAIGKKGQNVRLAAKLLGWKIDIKSEEEKRQEVEQQMSALVGTPTTPLDQVPDLGEGIVEKLSAAGVTTVEGLADMTPEQLEEIPGIGPKTIEKISLAVSNYFASLEAAAVAAAEAEASTGEAGEAVAVTELPPGPPDPSQVDPEATLTAARTTQGRQAGRKACLKCRPTLKRASANSPTPGRPSRPTRWMAKRMYRQRTRLRNRKCMCTAKSRATTSNF